MDEWVDRALPYWSILINVLLSSVMLPEVREAGVEYGRKFASLLTTAAAYFVG